MVFFKKLLLTLYLLDAELLSSWLNVSADVFHLIQNFQKSFNYSHWKF